MSTRRLLRLYFFLLRSSFQAPQHDFEDADGKPLCLAGLENVEAFALTLISLPPL